MKKRLLLSLGAGVGALFGVPLLLAGLARVMAWALGVPLDVGLPFVAVTAFMGPAAAVFVIPAAWRYFR